MIGLLSRLGYLPRILVRSRKASLSSGLSTTTGGLVSAGLFPRAAAPLFLQGNGRRHNTVETNDGDMQDDAGTPLPSPPRRARQLAAGVLRDLQLRICQSPFSTSQDAVHTRNPAPDEAFSLVFAFQVRFRPSSEGEPSHSLATLFLLCRAWWFDSDSSSRGRERD